MSYMISWIVAGSALASPAMADGTVGALRLFETVIHDLGTDDRRGPHRAHRLGYDDDDDDRGRHHGSYVTYSGGANRDDDDDGDNDDRGRTFGRDRDDDD